MILQIVMWGIGLWVLPMWIGWILWVLMVKSKLPISLATKGVFFAVVYGLTFLPLTVLVYGIDPWAYIIADIPFQINMMASNVITLTLFFNFLKKLLTELSTYSKIVM